MSSPPDLPKPPLWPRLPANPANPAASASRPSGVPASVSASSRPPMLLPRGTLPTAMPTAMPTVQLITTAPPPSMNGPFRPTLLPLSRGSNGNAHFPFQTTTGRPAIPPAFALPIQPPNPIQPVRTGKPGRPVQWTRRKLKLARTRLMSPVSDDPDPEPNSRDPSSEHRERVQSLKRQVDALGWSTVDPQQPMPAHLARYILRLRQKQRALLQKHERQDAKKRRSYYKLIVRNLQERWLAKQQQSKRARHSFQAAEGPFQEHDNLQLSVSPSSRLPAEEEVEHRRATVWHAIASSTIPKVHALRMQGQATVRVNARFLADTCERVAKQSVAKPSKLVSRELIGRARRIQREMVLFWKRNEKEEREQRRRAEKEAQERLKAEQEEREQRRQARKLHFLISQTELYGHFFRDKLGDAEISKMQQHQTSPATQQNPTNGELDFADIADEDLEAMARKNAATALAQQREKTRGFDSEVSKRHRAAHEESMDFQNPTLMPGAVEIQQPNMLTCQLKPYQLRGLTWLANLYEQGINGILADDMGLGKTVQSISLMAWLAETHNIWGPFLVVAPASTLHNWQQEITKFAPQLKTLPYWGPAKDRKVLRKFWNPKKLYSKDAPFHVLVTSYQLVVTDQQYFQRIKWQYMILDEAHAIKSAATTRWKVLLSFNCRNRLLLTGTPIQNSMQELWALLHFIMPTLFDSHAEFSEWFSKDIESHAEKKGALNEHQLNRLHMILKPFMLRRVKADVEHELGHKIEKTVYCELTPRQRRMYAALNERISIDELLEKATFEGKSIDESEGLMNVVMHFRKVCNHPQLFEAAEVQSPFYFFDPVSPPPAAPSKNEPDLLLVPYNARNPVHYEMPKFLYRHGILRSTTDKNGCGSRNGILDHLMNIHRADFVQASLEQDPQSLFAPLQVAELTPGDVEKAHRYESMDLGILLDRVQDRIQRRHAVASMFQERPVTLLPTWMHPEDSSNGILMALRGITSDVDVLYPLDILPPAYQPRVEAVPVEQWCSDRSFAHEQREIQQNPKIASVLFGMPSMLANPVDRALVSALTQNQPAIGPLLSTHRTFSPIWVPDAKQLLFESGKLQALDQLLAQLKAEGHRVLIFFQMTKMMDLLEEYLTYRQYSYLRLDGSSSISDRRDLVTGWQTRDDIFIFLLSTRAGGLGINLTAADTVIFYDSDWNPTMDQQAMDRAHRLGQTRQVTVYRMVTRGTIEERILERATQKDEIQKVVISGGKFDQE